MNLESFKHYRTGIPAIDTEHWWLFHLVDRAIATKDRDELEYVLGKLCADWSRHVAIEESVMSEAGFPYLEPHVLDHGSISQALASVRCAFTADGTIPDWRAHALEDLIRNHIDHYDMQYIDYIFKP